ncbi:hypothetical protein EV714DRAFT_270348 [Schizophyllum commune]
MHKNPFVPQPSYPHHQPPLPPGPPPAQPPAQDYSAYWAAAAAAQGAAAHPQAPTVGAYNAQWQPPQPAQPPRPTPEQSALYANYGYGPNWRPQQPQAPQHPPQPQAQYMQPPQPTAPVPPQPPFNPYQPQATYQPYIPQAGAPSQTFTPTPPTQPQFNPPQQPRALQHSPPNSFPPAKRQRFDGVPQGQMRSPQQQQSPPFGAPSGPSFNMNNNNGGFNAGPGRGGPPSGPANRGRGGMMGGRGGRGGGMGSMGPMGPNRGGFGNRSMRQPFNGNNNQVRGGPLPLRGVMAPRGNFGNGMNNNNRGGRGSFNAGANAGMRGRGGMHGIPSKPLGARDSMNASMTSVGGKKDENKRTLTDFKMTGFELVEIGWEWGAKPAPKPPVKEEEGDDAEVPAGETQEAGSTAMKVEENQEEADAALKEPKAPASADKPETNGAPSASSALPPRPVTQPIPLPPKPVFDESAIQPPEPDAAKAIPTGPRADAAASAPPPRIRLYFHTPAAADQGGSFTYGSVSDSRKGKRKKIEDDDGDDAEDERKRPLPPHLANGYRDDRSSVAPSIAPSAAEGSETGDWLMAAITEGASQEGQSEAGAPMSEDGMNGDVGMRAPDEVGENGTGTGERALTSVSTATATTTATASSGPTAGGNVAVPDATAASAMDTSAPQAPSLDEQGADQPSGTDAQVPTEPNSPAKGPVPMEGEPAPLVLGESLQDVEASQATDPPESQLVESQATTEPDSEVGDSQPTDDAPVIAPPTAQPTTDAHMAGPTDGGPLALTKTDAPVRTPSANRLSISYAGGTRRLIVDAESVQHLKLYRKEGRMEVLINVEKTGDDVKGILVECLTEPETLYLTMQTITEMAEKDPSIPPLARLTNFPTQLTLIAYLDTDRPLSEAKWARTGDVHEWLKNMFGRMFWVAGGADNGWEKRIVVMDPDPLPTIATVLEAWSTGSSVGTLAERQRFLKVHMSDSDNILEILLRLVRGERATNNTQKPDGVAPHNLSGPLLAAHNEHSAHAKEQTHVSLSVIALFRLTLEYARKAVGDRARKEVEERLGEIIKCIPNNLVHKSLDGIFKEWKGEKRGR